MTNDTPTLAHLHEHHGDFAEFRRLMQTSAAARFGPIWWGVWQTYVAPRVPEQGCIVDFGCGPGMLLRALRDRHADARLIGVEIQPAMLDALHEVAADSAVEVVAADLALPLPLAQASCDAAAAVMVLHEMPNPMKFLLEAARVLKPGAPLLVYDWVRQPLRRYVEGRSIDAGLLQHFREHCLYAPDDLAFLAESAGFAVQEVIGRKDGDYAMLALTRLESPAAGVQP